MFIYVLKKFRNINIYYIKLKLYLLLCLENILLYIVILKYKYKSLSHTMKDWQRVMEIKVRRGVSIPKINLDSCWNDLILSNSSCLKTGREI